MGIGLPSSYLTFQAGERTHMPMETILGLTVYTSPRRVLLYANLREIKLGCIKHGYTITAKRLRELAALCGEVAGLNIFVTAEEFDAQSYGLWAAEGFRPLFELPDKLSLKGKAVVIKSPIFQSPLQRLVEDDVANLHPDAVIFVSSNKVPPDLIGSLKLKNVKVIFLSPKQDSFGARGADELIFLGDVADANPLPTSLFKEERVVPESGYRTIFVPQEPKKESVWQRLRLMETATCEQLEKLLTLKCEDVDQMLNNLERLAKSDDLPQLTLAVLFVLSGFKRTSETGEELNKNRLWHQLLNFRMDAHRYGNLAFMLLVEEGTLCVEEDRDEMRFYYTRHPEDASHTVARMFCSRIIPLRGRLVMRDENTSFQNELLQALEIFSVNPADLTIKAQRDLMDWLLLLMRSLDNDARLTAYARLGLRPHEAVAMERQARAIIQGTSETDDEGSEGNEGGEDQKDTPSTPRLKSDRALALIS